MQHLYDIPVPQRTSTYSPVAHRSIIEEVREQLDRHNFNVHSFRVNSSRSGHQLIGFFDMRNNSDNEIGFRLVFKNSYDKSMSVGFAAGNVVWICSNGMMAGEVAYIRRHTGNVATELKQRIEQSINQLAQHYERVAQQSLRMKEIEVSKTDAAELCGRMFMEHDIIKATQLSIIKKEFESPSFEYGHPNTLWELYNFGTHSLKTSHPMNYMRQHMDFHQFLSQEYEL